jgi:hypothetical protein
MTGNGRNDLRKEGMTGNGRNDLRKEGITGNGRNDLRKEGMTDLLSCSLPFPFSNQLKSI